ncbi:hypothetical protein Mal64_07910 [Pseudobythopirellula maris]|uniref:Type II secretion system protein n=1 Tax=Pseudobythopirellula maris TaxID=2527991 RepID=A0A5C5ZS83_9BACT|nr:hypothetical protein [Pseudobythopirellula maris]TWT90402.1 hypothetical protein Mal64_07910 [Pseudobythopirellula maris]
MSKHRRHQRRGIASLVEVLAVVFISTAAFGLVGASLSGLVRLNQRFSHQASGPSDLDLLMRRLRTDVHASQSVRVDNGELSLATASGEVVYRLNAGAAERSLAEETVRFRLPTGCDWEINEPTTDAGRLLRIDFLAADHAGAERAVPCGSVVAEIDRRRRLFSAAESAQGEAR